METEPIIEPKIEPQIVYITVYAKSPAQREAHNLAVKKYYSKNKEQLLKYNREYAMEARANYTPEEREKFRLQSYAIYLATRHTPEYKETTRQYYLKKKDTPEYKAMVKAKQLKNKDSVEFKAKAKEYRVLYKAKRELEKSQKAQ